MKNSYDAIVLRETRNADLFLKGLKEVKSFLPIRVKKSKNGLPDGKHKHRDENGNTFIIGSRRLFKDLPERYDQDEKFPGDSFFDDDLEGFIKDMEDFGWEPFNPFKKGLDEWAQGFLKKLEDVIDELEKGEDEAGRGGGVGWKGKAIEEFWVLFKHYVIDEIVYKVGPEVYEKAGELVDKYQNWVGKFPAPKPAAGPPGPTDAGVPKPPKPGEGQRGGTWQIERIRLLLSKEGKKEMKEFWEKLKSGNLNFEDKLTLMDFKEWVNKQGLGEELENERLWRNIINGKPIPEKQDNAYEMLFWAFMVTQGEDSGPEDKKVWFLFRKAAPIDPRPFSVQYVAIGVNPKNEEDLDFLLI